MAQSDAGEAEYESDPEELKRSLATRRREASDDEEDDDEEVKNQRAEIEFDSEQTDEDVDNGENKSEEDGEDSYEEEEEGDDDDEYREHDEIDGDKRSKPAEDDSGGRVDGEEDKEEKQSSTVPTGGAFYMHDDRFQELSGGRSRRGRGGRRSWGSGDERKWGHDKYEEMNTQEKHHDKSSRGGFRGRGRGRGQGRGYNRGRSSSASSSNGHQIFVPKDTRRGGEPRKDEIPLTKGSQAHSVQSKSKLLRNPRGSQHWHEKIPHHDSRHSPSNPAKTGNGSVDADTKSNVVVSSLSSASPPFYPSVSSSNLVHGIQAGMERLQTNEIGTPSGKKLRNTKSVYVPVHTAQTFQPTGNRPLSSSTQRTSSSGNQCPPGEIASDTGAPFAKGKGTLQSNGSGSLMYSGSQVIGHAESLASGDNSNFPAFLPVMQFGGQHGGVPTFGMAFPGYVQPENGIGNPEMTWMPVLTGPGALGTSYSPPYTAIDGSYQAHKPGSTSRENSTNNLDLEKPVERPEFTESGVSKRQNSNQSKQPRRYSEMSFSK